MNELVVEIKVFEKKMNEEVEEWSEWEWNMNYTSEYLEEKAMKWMNIRMVTVKDSVDVEEDSLHHLR